MTKTITPPYQYTARPNGNQYADLHDYDTLGEGHEHALYGLSKTIHHFIRPPWPAGFRARRDFRVRNSNVVSRDSAV